MKRVTMQDIANEFGVSKVSVSKALANQPGTSRDLRERIQRKAFEMGYRGTARRATALPTFRFSIVVSDRFFFENEQFYTKIYMHLLQACTRRTLDRHLHVVRDAPEGARALGEELEKTRYDGVFITGEIPEAHLARLLRARVPLVAVDFYREHLPVDTIVIDNFLAGFTATDHLIHRGHALIGFLGNHRSTSSVSDRFFGYLKALTLHDLAYRRGWHIAENYEAGVFTHRFTLPRVLPSAFVCHCDSAAYQLMLLLRGRGLRVPRDVSLVAFDNTDASRASNPRISTIDINKREVA